MFHHFIFLRRSLQEPMMTCAGVGSREGELSLWGFSSLSPWGFSSSLWWRSICFSCLLISSLSAFSLNLVESLLIPSWQQCMGGTFFFSFRNLACPKMSIFYPDTLRDGLLGYTSLVGNHVPSVLSTWLSGLLVSRAVFERSSVILMLKPLRLTCSPAGFQACRILSCSCCAALIIFLGLRLCSFLFLDNQWCLFTFKFMSYNSDVCPGILSVSSEVALYSCYSGVGPMGLILWWSFLTPYHPSLCFMCSNL